MPKNPESIQLKNQFLENLEKRGCRINRRTGNAEVYRINGRLVNVRCRTKQIGIDGIDDRQFWYSFDFNIKAEFVVFITTSPDYFILMKPSELIAIKEKLYPVKKHPSTRTFNIDWDSLVLIGQSNVTPIRENFRSFDKYHDDECLPYELIK